MSNRLTQKEIEALFFASIDNANTLSEISVDNLSTKNKHISLGLAEIALEELGKSFTCLSMYSIDFEKYDWNNFWSIWKNHTIKAHRGFFYEFFSLYSIELENSNNYLPSKRKIIPQEKEVSFYVDFNKNSRTAIIPFNEVDNEELFNRTISIIGPLNTALTIKDKFINRGKDYRNALSDYARFTLENEVYQQDVLNILGFLKNDNREYNKGLDDIQQMFTTKLVK